MQDGISRRGMLGAAAALAAFGGGTAHGETSKVKVALLAPLSGAWARQGELMKAGVELAVEEINASGGIKALGGAKMTLLTFDAGDSAEKAKNAAQRMVAQEPDLIGGTGALLSSFTLAVTEVTERAELPWLTESYSDVITNRGFHYVFQTAMTAENQSATAMSEVTDLAKSADATVKTMAIVADNTASTVAFLKGIRQTQLAKYGIKLVLDEIYTPPLADVTSMIQRIRSTRPQLLFLGASNVSDTKLLLDKMSEFGVGRGRIPTLGAGGAMSAPEMVQIVGKGQLQGLLIVVANWAGKGHEDLIRRFVARSKEPWMGQDAIQTYFDMMLLKEAVERAGVADRHKVADVLHSIDITDGPAKLLPGGRVKFDDKGRIADANMVLVQWQDGKPVPVYPPNIATAHAIWGKA